MIYTTLDNISRKLVGRLNLVKPDLSTLYPTDNPTQSVDPDLVESLVSEQEYYLDLVLGQIYNLPLANKHPILTTIIDSLVISELMLVHFLGVTAGLGADTSGYGLSHQNKANTLLNQLTAGFNIVIPGMFPVPPSYPGVTAQRRLELPNEVLLTKAPPKILVNNITIMAKLDGGDRSDEIVEKDYEDNPFSMDYRHNNDQFISEY